jgi:uncharacterized protein (TIGR02001 family)
MRKHLITLTALALGAVAAPALAQDAAPAAAPSEFTISGGATAVTDYRFRGISQTNKRFAVQGTLGVAHSSGAYIGTWGSSVDDYIANGSDQEIDLYGGYKKTIDGTTVDVGMLYYYYPGSHGANTDFFEPYASVSKAFGPVSAKVGGNYAWKQHGLSYGVSEREDNAYVYGELSAGVPNTGFTVTGHLGHNFDRSFITGGTHYTDWNVTAAYAWKNLTASIAYVDTDNRLYSYPVAGTGGPNRNVTKAGVLGSIGVAF